MKEEFDAGESLAADFFADGAVELGAEQLIKFCTGPSAIAVKTSDADSDFPRRKIHDLELEVLEVA